MNDKVEWVLVPREPTEAMWNAGKHFCDGHVTRAIQTYAAMLAAAPKPEAQAAGVDVRARYFLASGLDEYGHHSEAQNVRDGEDLESYRHELFAIKAALSTPASHDAQQPEAAGALAREGNALRAIAEGNLGDGPGQANYLRIREFARAALSAAPAPAQQPAVVGDFDEWYASYDGIGGPKNPEQLARDAWERAAVLTPAATPGVEMVPYSKARDLLGDAYNAGTHGIGYSQQVMELQDAAQKEGNGNG